MTKQSAVEAAAESYVKSIKTTGLFSGPAFKAGHVWTLQHDEAVIAMRDALDRIVANPTCDSSHFIEHRNNWSDWAKSCAQRTLAAYEAAVKELGE